MYEQNENICKERELHRRNQNENLELKSTIVEMKNWLEGLKSRFKPTEQSISELESFFFF
jgi:hypothetical protein